MAVVHVKEITGRQTEQDNRSRKRYTRVFQVLTSLPTDGCAVVLNNPLIPAYNTQWESYRAGELIDFDSDAKLIEKRANQSDGENLQNWLVTCDYAGLGDPRLEPPVVDWGEEKYQEVVQKDLAGALVANSAGTPFASGLTRDRTRLTVTINRNVIEWDPVARAQYVDTLNFLPFLPDRHPPGFAPGLCKIDTITARPVYYENYPDLQDIHYWRETIKVSIDKRGWNASYLDAGFEKLVFVVPYAENQRVRIIDSHGGYPAAPQPLNGSGDTLAVGAEPVYLDFIRYPTMDWTPLNIVY